LATVNLIRYLWLLLSIVPAFAWAQDHERQNFTTRLAEEHHVPFSSAVRVGNTLYIAGTTGVDLDTKGPVSIEAEAHLVMDQVKQSLERAGFKMDDLVSVQVFCTDLANYTAFNNVYRTYFHGAYPARSFIAASKLLFGARFEVMGIAVRAER
jgi:2-iminobutanoate/2-iminopropanoate deaminase